MTLRQETDPRLRSAVTATELPTDDPGGRSARKRQTLTRTIK